jgi:zinc protease
MKPFCLILSLLALGVIMPKNQAYAAQDAWPPMPQPGPAPEFSPPSYVKFQLSNGISVTFIPAGKVPITHLQINAYSGYAQEGANKRGLATFASRMPIEGTKKKNGMELSAALQTLASSIQVYADLEYSGASLNALDDKLDATLSILADVLQEPAFNETDVERVRKNLQNSIFTEKDNLRQTADKVFRCVLFGDAYLGQWQRGTHESIQGITRDDLVQWHQAVWQPKNVGITVVSGMDQDVIQASLEKVFGPWQSAAAPLANLVVKPKPAHEGVKVYWVQKDGASQSVLSIGNTAPAFDPAHSTATQTGNKVLGGQFTSRINMNLREDKGYTYGARSGVTNQKHAGYYRATASVKANTTALSIVEFLKEFKEITSDKPITEQEFKNATSSMLQGFPAYFEKSSGILSRYASVDAYRRPADWLQNYHTRVSGVTIKQAQTELQSIIDVKNLIVVVVGDWKIAGDDVAALNLGPVVYLDHNGNKASP